MPGPELSFFSNFHTSLKARYPMTKPSRSMNKVYYIIGVSGSGKTTIGKLLAKQLRLPFHDADDFHPEANIQKMKNGFALNDEDRQPWLESLAIQAQKALEKNGAVITCSALKAKYRKMLEQNIANQTCWIFLDGSPELIQERMKNRSGHFMPIELLKSQFDALEKPENAITISIFEPPEQIVQRIIHFIVEGDV